MKRSTAIFVFLMILVFWFGASGRATSAFEQLQAQIVGGCVGTTQTCRALNIDSNGNLNTVPASTSDQKTVTGLCAQTTVANFTVVGVANSAGSSVTSTTSCIAGTIYVNNTSNSTVTLRLQDKAGSPVIWIGGNADFSIPANSNLPVAIPGLVFTSGITAIAGTNGVLNLFIPTLQ